MGQAKQAGWPVRLLYVEGGQGMGSSVSPGQYEPIGHGSASVEVGQ